MSSQAVYCLSLQIPTNASGKCAASIANNNTTTNNNVNATTTTTATTKHTAIVNNSNNNYTTTAANTKTKITFASMQQQQQQQQQPLQKQHQHPQQPQQQLTNNIILLRGSRNENGQIVIQNKHDIISFLNEHQQQQQQLQQQHQLQQQQQNDKTTATLTQLPTTTTVARKTFQTTATKTGGISLVAKDGAAVASSAAAAAAAAAAVGGSSSNTILLQTPINASQLESVLLQTASLKKSQGASSSTTSLLNERPFLLKNSSRSLSSDSSRLGHASNKGPFVLQTLKRLEKSQSILVIRNSASASATSSSASASAAAAATNTSSAHTANASTSTSTNTYTAHVVGNDRKSVSSLSSTAITTAATTTTTLPNTSTATNALSASSSLSSSSTLSSTTPPTTASVSTNTQTGALSFTRATKGQQTQATVVTTTTTKLGNILANNRTTLTPTAALKSTASSAAVHAATTYLRLGSSSSNNNNNNNNNNKHAGHTKNHNSNIAANNKLASGHNNSNNSSNNNNNRNILNGLNESQLTLADVQLKQERTTNTVATTTAAAATSATTAQQQQQLPQHNAPLGSDGEPIKLPDNLESLPRADSFPSQRHRWNTNEEIAAILISFDKHVEWQSKEVKTRPKSGSLLLYSRKKVRYRRDGYCWKKRKDGKTTREDHMKLKVQGTECIYGCYVHSAILPTFHRRCYWLLQNPDIVLVHYLNVPYPDDNKMAVIAPSITLWGDKKEWTKDELVSQLKPMLSTVTSDDDSDSGNDIEISTAETVESIVSQLMEKQRLSRQAALVKQLDCGCGDAACADGKTCTHPIMRRPSFLKSVSEKRGSLSDGYGQSASGTPNVVVNSKLYSRWSDRRTRDSNMDNHQYLPQQLPQESAIKFQIIPPTQHNEQQQQQHASSYQQQQNYRQHAHNNGSSAHQLLATRSNLVIQQQQQQHHQQQQQQQHHQQQLQQQQQQLQQQQQQTQHQSNFNQTSTTTATAIAGTHNNNQISLQRFVANQNSSSSNNNNSQLHNRLQIAKITTNTSATADNVGGGDMDLIASQQNHMSTNSNSSANSNSNKINRNTNNCNTNSSNSNSDAGAGNSSQLAPHQQQNVDLNVINNNGNSNSNTNNNNNYSYTSNPQQQQFYKLQPQTHKQTTNDIKMPPLHQQLQVNTSNIAPHSNASTVEPMCMSPEHHPSTPFAEMGSISNSSNSSNPSASSSISPTSVPSPAVGSLSSTQLLMDAGNQKQSTVATTSATTTSSQEENLISSHDTLRAIEIAAAVDERNVAVELSSGNDMKQHISSSNNTNTNNNNNIENSNNQGLEYNSNSSTSNGCVNIGASSDNNSTIAPQQQAHAEVGVAPTTHTQELVDFETMEINGNNEAVAEHSTHELHDSLSFFNVTLDLSHEDIQRTLLANMPFGGEGGKAEGDTLPPIDFMGSTCAGSSGGPGDDEIPVPGVATCGDADDEDADDVFANLDAFDMLVEFPELDLDDKQALSHTVLEQAVVLVSAEAGVGPEDASELQQPQLHYESAEQCAVLPAHCSSSKKLLSICDFSPEWSYPEGGIKVLVAGPWTANASYTVLFDAQPVPTALVQAGVLRCYCPAHEIGYATLQVSCDGYIISNSVMFEYKLSPYQEAPFDANFNDCLYKFTLLNRLSAIDEKMQVQTAGGTLAQQFFLQTNFEDKLVAYCHQLAKQTWQTHVGAWTSGYKRMTLLHLAAALGYSKLVCAMLNWRAENPHIILETEIDALSQDVHGYTPMAWACACDHVETAALLYKWNHNALKIKNHAQQTPLEIANVKGHKQLLAEICRLEHERNKQSGGSLSSLSLDLNKYNSNELHTKLLPATADALFAPKDTTEHVYANFDLLEAPKSHDGVFLRPVAVASNQSPPSATRFSKRSSVDSGINMDFKTKPGKSFKDITRLHSFDAHDNFNLAVDSPLDTLTATTNSLLSPLRKMDFALCEVSTGDSSPLPDKDNDDTSTLNNDDISNEAEGVVGDSDAKVLTLAEHIIAAMPERIKNEADELMVLGSPMTEPLNSESSGLNDSFMDPLLDSLPNTHFDSDFSFDFNDHSYRYHDVSTPCSSLSPASSGPLQSPASYSILGADPSVSSPSPPPSTKQLTEFLHASSSAQYPFEADFSKLTLTDTEQRELYEAAKCIQKAYRSYKGRQKLEEQNKERTAAIVIQNYYRRYKQYAYYRQMTNAALVIQHGYRSYCRNKRFKKSPASTTTTLSLGGSQHSSNSQFLSSYYDNYRNDQQQQQEFCSQPSTPKETSPSGPLKRTYSQSTQNQAARKIQQFMRQSRIKLQRERAEKEKLVHQRREEYLQSLQHRVQLETVCPAGRSETATTKFVVNNTLLTSQQHQQQQQQQQQLHLPQ